MSLNVMNEVTTYGDGDELGAHIKVSSHWQLNGRVIIEIDGKKATVLASELKRAIDNAANT